MGFLDPKCIFSDGWCPTSKCRFIEFVKYISRLCLITPVVLMFSCWFNYTCCVTASTQVSQIDNASMLLSVNLIIRSFGVKSSTPVQDLRSNVENGESFRYHRNRGSHGRLWYTYIYIYICIYIYCDEYMWSQNTACHSSAKKINT